MDKLLPYSLQSSTVYAGHFYYYIYKYSRKEVGGMLEQLKQLEIEIMDERKYGRAHLIFLGQKRKG